METSNAASQASPPNQDKTGHGDSHHEDCNDSARWVAQLDTTQRQAYAANLQDRIRIVDRILELVVNARREGRLQYGPTGRACCNRALPNGGVPAAGTGPSKPATAP